MLCLAVGMAGCHLLPEGKKIDYKSAGKLPPLEVPPDLTAPGTDERYVVPDINPSGSATFSAYSKDRNKQPGTGGGTSVLPTPDETSVRVERSGTQRWLVVKQRCRRQCLAACCDLCYKRKKLRFLTD